MPENKTIPQDKGLENSLKLKKEGYRFVQNRMAELDTEIFSTHLMARKVICITGADAVGLFYDNNKFTRKGVAPGYVKKTLFGENTVHGLEGKEHQTRRQMFLSILSKEAEEEFIKIYKEYLDKSISVWEFHEPIVLFDAIKVALFTCVCQWASVPVDEEIKNNKANECMEMVFGFGTEFDAHEEGKAARKSFEEWMEKIFSDIRQGFIEVPKDSPVYKVCEFKDDDGNVFDNHMAAVEMINVIRPIVASTIYITFAALALHENPECLECIRNQEEHYLYKFCEEVRRYYPLAPFLGAIVKEDFVWKGYPFKKNEHVLLDVYGINHDPNIWKNPNQFDPENFSNLSGDSDKLVAQGSGDMQKGHRCPGERITKRILEASVEFLAITIEYELVKGQDITYELTKIPTLPKDKIVIHNIARRPK